MAYDGVVASRYKYTKQQLRVQINSFLHFLDCLSNTSADAFSRRTEIEVVTPSTRASRFFPSTTSLLQFCSLLMFIGGSVYNKKDVLTLLELAVIACTFFVCRSFCPEPPDNLD